MGKNEAMIVFFQNPIFKNSLINLGNTNGFDLKLNECRANKMRKLIILIQNTFLKSN